VGRDTVDGSTGPGAAVKAIVPSVKAQEDVAGPR